MIGISVNEQNVEQNGMNGQNRRRPQIDAWNRQSESSAS